VTSHRKPKGSSKADPKTASAAGPENRKQERAKTGLKPERKTSFASQAIVPGQWQTNAVAFALLVIATVALYWADLHLDFFRVDDPQYVVNNPWIRGFSLQNLRHVLTTPYFVNYSPLHLLSYTLDYVVAGLNAFAFHLSSNLWAGVVAGFVFLVALVLTRHRVVAIAAAALFVVHPAHVEAIAWISSRKDLVAAAFALPSLLAYLHYRRGGMTAQRWYVASVLLFLFAVGGKLSVATFPVVFLAHDLFVEKRPLARSLVDKAPFLLAAGLIALVVAFAQPPTGSHPNAYALFSALGQNLWLLSGFGTYVIYRVPPNSAGMALQLIGVASLLAVFAAPLLIRRRWPIVVVLLYWILFALIPSQALSFAYPVADRYLFFPSVPAVILVAWGVTVAAQRLGRRGAVLATVALAAIGLLWVRTTFAYVAEWRDPRSVWYAATGKSVDPLAYYNLGWHYLDIAARLGDKPRKARLSDAEARRFASAVWAGDSRLLALLGEWSTGQHGGLVEKAFQEKVRTLAWDALDRALLRKGRHVMPELYFHRGLILLDRAELAGARKEFLAAIDEASRSTFAEGRQEITVNSYNDLGILAWTEGNYREALRWLRMAEEEQTRFGGNWVPDLTANRQRLEAIVASLPNG
jgi:hypothetical protein